jgi:pimeloyl-ACP methyl ester carboxylesterase
VATVGGSMGGIAVVRHAALVGGVDAVVAISTPARWDGHRSAAVRRMTWLTGSPRGRRLMRAAGVRLPDAWDRPESPEDLVGKIAPVPLLIVHGRDDHFFDEEEAWRLYRRAGQPKRLLLARPFGHAEDGYTVELAERVARFLYGAWERPWPG